MPDFDIVLTYLGLPLVGTTIVGIVRRGRLKLCRMFVLFLVVVWVTDIFPTLWPQFYTRNVWLLRESLHNVLRFAVALEVAYFAFRSFPGARSTARALLLLLLTTTLAAVLTTRLEFRRQSDFFIEIIGQIQIPNLIGIVWLLMGITVLILWYRLPVDRMHKAILLGWIPFLLVFSGSLKLAYAFGWEEQIDRVNLVNSFAYSGLLTFWAVAAWAPAGAHARFREPLAVPARLAS